MDIVRIATAGSVDDGKSTLIGRLLYETNSITADKLEAIERASKRRGVDYTDLSLLTDGLIAEREQGITIDVAHIYFSTPTRKYIIADTPGHFEYTRNMITGASNAQVAIILIDARNGIVEQTHRHFYITQLLRIPYVVVCVNKMDLVNYAEEPFNQIRQQFEELFEKANYKEQSLQFIPASSLYGDNISTRSSQLDWYDGPSLLEFMEGIDWHASQNQLPARFPVQYVIRPKSDQWHDFRGFAGKLSSGTLSKGDTVVALPSLQESVIEDIYKFEESLNQAESGDSVVITLKDEIDISRGDMIVKKSEQPAALKEISAQVCWLDHTPLKAGKTYLLQHGSNRVKAKITNLYASINVLDYKTIDDVEEIGLNEIGYISLKTAKPVNADTYAANKRNGSFILIDEGSNSTVGVGFIG
ncbi:GTP-binding protein [Flavihumibacter sp. RY-1]|uniref:sulfate adenylyltransferase n=1 Tax=Flavihumibacter fluminis TaxID=2909236 RepID=A0ABS9BDI2_9BACT|nr:GTP-binding protein [Flavihumibacter fluminis]MBU7576863.1 50S ribosome-binding GTPase [Flavihumibacter sp.]MCF1713149.1 GTP-binding protein [Flavihumibacter fluminis]